MKRIGFSLIEVLVALAIIALLLSLLLPAVQRAREAARSTSCKSRLHQIGLAIHNYESAYGMWPAGSFQYQSSWHVAILPQLDQASLYQRVNFSPAQGISPTTAIDAISISTYLCPSDPSPEISSVSPQVAANKFLGNSGTGLLANAFGYDGMFAHSFQSNPRYAEGRVRLAEVTDGRSVTAAVAEVLHSDLTLKLLRTVGNTPQAYQSTELQQFRDICSDLPPIPSRFGWMGGSSGK